MRVIISQPVIPHYRVPLFAGLAAQPDLDLKVMACREFPHSPGSVTNLPDWADLSHRCLSFGSQLFWQCGMRLPDSCGPGDVLVIAGNPRILSNMRLARQAVRRGMGLVWWSHLWSPTSVPWRARLRFRQMRRADVALLYTDDEVRSLASHQRAGQVVMAAGNAFPTTGIDQILENASSNPLTGVAQPPDHKLLLFCGRLRTRPPTELEIALQALRRLRSGDQRYSLAVVGTGDDLERLQRIAVDLAIDRHVLWLGEIYDEELLAPWFLKAGCLLYPGAIGLTLLHAFAYGLPVVTHASRELHNPEIAALVDGENGLLFARGNVEDLCAKLRSVCDDPDRRRRLSECAFRTVRERYSMSAMIARFRAAVDAASRLALLRHSMTLAA